MCVYIYSRQQRHDLGRCDGSEDLKPMDHDVIDVDQLQDFSYGVGGGSSDLLQQQHKHYILPDYGGVGKDYVIGATADVFRLNSAAPGGYDATDEYQPESRDRIQQQQQQAAMAAAMQRVAGPTTATTTPRIHYHVYESPQMT